MIETAARSDPLLAERQGSGAAGAGLRINQQTTSRRRQHPLVSRFMNLLHDHPDTEVRKAAIRLMDALTTWNRGTGRENVVIIKDTIGCEIRALSGAPAPAYITDAQLLEVFDNIAASQCG